MRLSYSRLDVYRKCYRRFDLQYNKNLPVPVTGPLRIGSAAHEFMHQYAENCLAKKVGIDLDFGMELRSKIINTMTNIEDIDDLGSIIERVLETYCFDRSDRDSKIYLEQKFAFDKKWDLVSWDDPLAKFRGIIDRYERFKNYIEIVDYKTDRRIRNNAEVQNDMQLKLYAFILWLLYREANVVKVNVSLDFIRYGKRVGPFEYYPDNLAELQGYFDNLFVEIDDRKDWYPQIGDHCEYCPFLGECDLYSRSGMHLLDNASPQELAEWLFKSEILSKQIKSKLKKHVENSKPILVGGSKLDFHEKKRKSVENIEELVEKLIEIGVPREKIWDGLTASYTKMKQVVKGHEFAPKLIDQYLKESTYTQFGFDDSGDE